MKKLLIIPLLFLTCQLLHAQKFSYVYQGVEFKCKVKGQAVCITSFNTKAPQVIIPAMVSNKGTIYPVKSVSTFLNGVNYLVVSLTLEEGIEEIDDYSFNEFRKLTKLYLPSTIRHIGKNAIRNNIQLTIDMADNISEQSLRDGIEMWPQESAGRQIVNQHGDVLALKNEKKEQERLLAEAKRQQREAQKMAEQAEKTAAAQLVAQKAQEEKERKELELAQQKIGSENNEEKKGFTGKLLSLTGLRKKKNVKEDVKSINGLASDATPTQVVAATASAQPQVVPSDVDINIPVASKVKSDTYCVIIANEKYEDVPEVEFAARDGEVFKEYCIKTLGIPEKQIKTFINASYTDIKRALNWMEQIANVTEGKSRMILYYAGHGMPNEKDKTAYLIPVDGFPKDITTCFKLSELYSRLGKIKSQDVTVFLDACFSGVKRGSGQALVAARGIAIKPKEETLSGNMVVFTAASDDETALSYQEKRHGMFTYFLLSKLKETKGEVSFGELYKTISSEVKKNSMLENDKLQTPSVNVSSSMMNNWDKLHF